MEGHPRYRGPVLDAHCHYDTHSEVRADEVNRAYGLTRCINLWDLEWPPRPYVEAASTWDHRVRTGDLCLVPDLTRVRDDRAEYLARDVQAASAAGAVGVKVWKNLGLWLTDEAGNRLTIDDERLDPLWLAAGEAGLPVMIHVGDPPAFFAPLTDDNPRIVDLRAHPDWWYGRGGFPSLEELHREFETVVAQHPRTIFVGVHFGCFMDLPEIDRMLGEYDNYRIDTSAAIADLGVLDPCTVRDFFVRHSERIVFGTDLVRTSDYDYPVHPASERWDLGEFFDRHWRFFETDLEGLAHPLPAQGDWSVHGIDLPTDVLDRLYHANAEALFGDLP